MTIYCCPTWLDWVATQINQKQNWKGKERKERKSFKWNTWRIWKGGRSLEKCHNVVLNIPNTKVPIMMGLILRKHFYYWKEGSGFLPTSPLMHTSDPPHVVSRLEVPQPSGGTTLGYHRRGKEKKSYFLFSRIQAIILLYGSYIQMYTLFHCFSLWDLILCIVFNVD